MSFVQFICMSLFISTTFAGFFPAGPLGGLHAPCVSSVQCVGVAVCVQQQCECPAPLYRAVGGACQFVTYNTFRAVPAVRTTIVHAYPGNPCGPSLNCVGGSTCLQGLCCCSPGFVAAGTSCVVGVGAPALPAFPAPIAPAVGFPAFPAAPIVPNIGGFFPGFNAPGPVIAPVAPIVAPVFGAVGPVGFGCGGGCFGGQVCVANACQCPNGYIAKAGACGPLVPVIQVGPGGPCAAGEECTGGSVCNAGICCCPGGLIQIGAVCVLPPRPPPPPPTFVVSQTVTTYVAPGAPCAVQAPCAVGASCVLGTCRCGGAYFATGSSCVLRK